MNALLLLALALGPGLILLHRMYVRDVRREPLSNVTIYVVYGALSVIPAAIGEVMLRPALIGWAAEHGTTRLFLLLPWTLIGVGFVEEIAKRLALHARARHDPHLDEPFDWVVYAVAVSLGFATIENVLYVMQSGAGAGIARAFTAVPAHAFNGTMMGARLALASMAKGPEAARQRRLAVIEPAIWHGLYDFTLFLGHEAPESSRLGWIAGCAWIVVFIAQWRACVKRLKTMVDMQQRPLPALLMPDSFVRRWRNR